MWWWWWRVGMSGQDIQQGLGALGKHMQYYNLIIYLNIYIWKNLRNFPIMFTIQIIGSQAQQPFCLFVLFFVFWGCLGFVGDLWFLEKVTPTLTRTSESGKAMTQEILMLAKEVKGLKKKRRRSLRNSALHWPFYPFWYPPPPVLGDVMFLGS